MKKIYTSNYARCANNPNAFGISYIVPPWYNGEVIVTLAPTREMVEKRKYNKAIYSEEEYANDYIDLLMKRLINPDWLVEDLPDGAILLCYEPPGDFCHRRILAEWIQGRTGIPVPEWKNEKELQAEKQNKVVDSMLDF
jgi:hypothetical protein